MSGKNYMTYGDAETIFTGYAAAIKSSGVADGAGAHNGVYRGKYLGTQVTAGQWAAIGAGTFDDLYIGDYWTISGVNWRIAAFDYWLGSGEGEVCTKHHVVIVPDTGLDSKKMNDSRVTTGGYVGSKMYTSYITTSRNTIKNTFGSAHILSHRQLLSNAVDENAASAWAWYNSTVELMPESMVYGVAVGGKPKVGSVNFNIGIDKAQLPLFAINPLHIANREAYYLRDVVSETTFAFVDSYGNATSSYADVACYVRPAFGIC